MTLLTFVELCNIKKKRKKNTNKKLNCYEKILHIDGFSLTDCNIICTKKQLYFK